MNSASGRRSLAAALSALFLVFSFPTFPRYCFWPAAWLALVPLIGALTEGGWRNGLVQTVCFGYPFMVGVLAWVDWMGKAPWLLLAVTQLAYVAVFCMVTTCLAPLWRRRSANERPLSSHLLAVTVPAAAWVVMEWFRTLGKLSIPWGFLSNTQVHLSPLVATSRWWGAFGVSFIIVCVNAAVANLLSSIGRDGRRAWKVAGCLSGIVVFASGAAWSTRPGAGGAPVRIGVVQGNIFKKDPRDPAYRQTVLDTYSALSRQAAERGAELIVWPETVVPGPLTRDPYVTGFLKNLARSTGKYYLVGSHLYDPAEMEKLAGPYYNSAFLIAPGGDVLGRYDKQHLVPFGEYVPGRNWIPFLQSYGVPARDLLSGRGHHALPSPIGSLGVMICYESMYPAIPAATVRSGASILFVMTNDQWFGESSAAYDHAAEAAFRAAETGRWVVQAASTGVSLFADPSGVLHEPTSMYTRAVEVKTVEERSGATLYTTLGDWPPYLALLFLAFLVPARCRSRELKSAAPSSNGMSSPE